jgi:hypothetical protein
MQSLTILSLWRRAHSERSERFKIKSLHSNALAFGYADRPRTARRFSLAFVIFILSFRAQALNRALLGGCCHGAGDFRTKPVKSFVFLV